MSSLDCKEEISIDIASESDKSLPLLSWKSIYVESRNKSSIKKLVGSAAPSRTILDDVSGLIRPSTLLGIIGSSGSGKTTLLNVLNFRCLNSDNLLVKGSIMINGHKVNSKVMSQISCYVQQDDLFFGTLTVKEHLLFHALLRMDKNIDKKTKLARIDEVIKQLDLNKCRNTLIGIPGVIKGLSGGEKRRLAFATEILRNPSILFCDEVSSGLDSYLAKSIISCLKQMTATNKMSILCTIHQPSSEIFELFDQLLILANGKTIFFGEAKRALSFFEEK